MERKGASGAALGCSRECVFSDLNLPKLYFFLVICYSAAGSPQILRVKFISVVKMDRNQGFGLFMSCAPDTI